MTVKNVKPGVLALAALGIGILFNVLFFQHLPGLSVPLFTVILLGVLAGLDRVAHRRFSWYQIAISGTVFVLSLFFVFRASPILLALDAALMVYLVALLFVSLYGAPVQRFRLLDYVAFPFTDLLANMGMSAGILKRLRPSSMARHTRVLRGGGLGLVLFAVFVSLFAMADPVFAELLSRVITVEFLQELIPRLVQIGLVFLAALLLLSPAFFRHTEQREPTAAMRKWSLGIEAAIALGVTNAVFALFLIVRAAYLFGGDARLAEFNLTYAEYARQGFFQLMVVAAIVAIITWAMRHVQSGRGTVVNQVLQSVLLVQTGLVLVSSWMALVAYEAAYGFTHLRVFSHAGLVLIGAFLVILLVGVLAPKLKDADLLNAALGVTVLAVLAVNIMNPDLFIANKNIARWELGEELDYELLLLDLSDDAAPAIVEHAATLSAGDLAEDTGIYSRRMRFDQLVERELYVSTSGTLNVATALAAWDDDRHKIHRYEMVYNEETRQYDYVLIPHDTAWQSWNVSRAWKVNHSIELTSE